ncbi:MAG: chemotaxis protein CheA [Deltaproteobacteria bacterium]|nr:chemotaxis protein CheA [Deltaproteobacteria bacterium]
MMSEKITTELDAVAEELITADLANLQDLGRLITCFQILLKRVADCGITSALKPVSAAIDLIKDAILNESADRKQLLNVLNATVSCLQQSTRSGSTADNVKFPDELFLKITTAQERAGGTAGDTASNQPQHAQLQGDPNPPDDQSADRSLHNYLLPLTIDENMFADFLNEQSSILDKAEGNILSLEKSFTKDVLDDVRRIFHTMKSESAVFEIASIALLCHGVEDLLDSQPAEISFDKLLLVIDWLKYAFDCLKTARMLPDVPETLRVFINPHDAPGGQAALKPSPQGREYVINPEPISAMHSSVRNQELSDKKSADEPYAPPVDASSEKTSLPLVHMDVDLLSDFTAEVQEHIDTIDQRLLVLENDPADQENLNAVFRVFHTIKGAAGFLALDEISKLAHMTENILDRARKGEFQLSGGRIDIIFEAVDEMKRLIQTIHTAIASGSSSYPSSPTLEPLIQRIQTVAAGSQVLQQAGASQGPRRQMSPSHQDRDPAPEQAPVQNEQPDSFFSLNAEVADLQENPDDAMLNSGMHVSLKMRESIKVDSERLDKLIDAIGELVIIESMIRQDSSITSLASSVLLQNISQMDKITRELQQLAMSLRMIPVKGTFQKMARVVRDLAKKSNKKIEFISSGEDAMLDKSVVDRIGDPLIHLVRNSVDHGIEASSSHRVAADKNETGKIELNAYHKGGNIFIEVKDDGGGLDKKSILAKAKERGLTREGQVLSDREIFNFILLPGFSTALKLTEVSGRGVGMDVVKRAMDDLRGNIDIESEEGAGTTFTLRLPLTLAIIDGMLVRIGSERYIIPTLSIVEAVRPEHDSITSLVNRGEMITIRDNIIPLFRLGTLFSIADARQDPAEGIVIVVEDSGKMAGILVDELLGQQSIVIKSMGATMKGLPGVSGGSILSDGRVGIIIDVAGIVKLAMSGSLAG